MVNDAMDLAESNIAIEDRVKVIHVRLAGERPENHIVVHLKSDALLLLRLTC